MAKLLIIEWDTRELRLVTAQNQVVDRAWAVPLSSDSPEAVTAALKSEVEEHRLQKVSTLVAVSRRDVEIREISIPPSPPEEHPDMVRMLAPREFAQFDDNSVVDFYEIGRQNEMHCMLAAAMEHGKLQRLKRILEAAQLVPQSFALRPLCAAALMQHEPPAPRLIIDMACEEADIAVHNGVQTLSVRNIRLPHENSGEALKRDIKRTLAAATGPLGKPVAEVVLFGGANEHTDVTAGWDFNAPVRVVDPAQSTEANLGLQHPSRFASLLGLARLSYMGKAPEFDFLNPRQRPPAERKLTPAMLAGICGLLLLLTVGAIVYMRLNALESKAKSLATEVAEVTKAVAAASEIVSHHDDMQTFLDARVDWLKEMGRVSANSMEYSDVTFTKWISRASDSENGGGMVSLDGGAKTPETIQKLEQQLRDSGHSVDGRGHVLDPKDNQHPYHFRQMLIAVASPSTLEDLRESAGTNDGTDSPSDSSPSPSDAPSDAPSDRPAESPAETGDGDAPSTPTTPASTAETAETATEPAPAGEARESSS
ncbi:MAG: hypothetical protein KDB14_13785 [Planctomycetales bacterium]|nr:hypothetical protein [Planctomycetales bacterium]